MKLSTREVDRFLRAPDPAVRAALVYGPDGGLVRERALALVAVVAEDPADPFRVAELNSADIRSDPARLGDEAAALSFGGGRRAVRVRDADDGVAPVFKDFLAGAIGDSLVVVEAGDLPARSALRKAFEAAPHAAAVPCYRDDERSLPTLISQVLRDAGQQGSPEAIAYLAANLGGDRQLTRRELEKLTLYVGDRGRVELEDAQACVGDTAALSLEDLAFAVGAGDVAGADRALARSLQEGANPVAALRAVARHIQRLHLAAGHVARGTPAAQAVKQLRPPVFWKLASGFETQVRSWSTPELGRALGRLLEAERACKRTGAPAELLCEQALLSIARAAVRGSERGARRR